ncbi:MAG TPA: M48 family metalloprotease [Candidatus Angelobacter sp.]
MRSLYKFFILLTSTIIATAAWAGSDNATASASTVPPRIEAVTERIFLQEAKLVESMHGYTPLVETYVQRLKGDNDLWTVPDKDRYFLGRLVLGEKKMNDQAFKDHNQPRFISRVLDRLDSFYRINYRHLGFMQTIFLKDAFDKDHYDLKYVRQQFLGEVRTLVFDVMPRPHTDETRFQGRIWVEDQDYNIVRINGTYGPNTETKYYFHFDSWRVNMQPGVWLPAYVYTEETDAERDSGRKLSMKGQTRLWAYDLKHSGRQSELTTMQVEANDVTDTSSRAPNEILPVQSQHLWEREAEDNVLDRMERAGVLAPDGEVSKVLQTVVNNLEITNNLNIEPEVRCRVLLTTPLESFTVGNTIVISRGLLDVLPDESSLAMILARELGHIALGHRMNTKYSFSDRMLFPDERVFMQIDMVQNGKDEQAADQKGMELLANSPYKDKLATAGLFLNVLGSRSPALTWLVSPHFGNRLSKNSLIRQAAVAQAPALEVKNIAQVPALPLGSRIKMDPWDDRVEMLKSKPVALRSVRDKMSFEVTPVYPNLVNFTPLANREVATNPAQ